MLIAKLFHNFPESATPGHLHRGEIEEKEKAELQLFAIFLAQVI